MWTSIVNGFISLYVLLAGLIVAYHFLGLPPMDEWPWWEVFLPILIPIGVFIGAVIWAVLVIIYRKAYETGESNERK